MDTVVVRIAVLTAVVMTSFMTLAFPQIPKAGAKALGVTRGKSFSSGAVFINGKYLEPPYVVERWGTGIRINQKQVTGQIIDWTEFLKTQSDVKVTTTAPDATVAAVAPVAAPAASSDSEDSSLDDLFDDNPTPKKKQSATRSTFSAKPKIAKPTVSYSLSGDFVANDESKKLLVRINSARTDIDRMLRSGGFICFGDSYTQVTGDARTLNEMLARLPELMQNAQNEEDFCNSVRNARLVYLNDGLRRDFYRNRVDYRKLKELRSKLKSDQQLRSVFGNVY